MKLAEKRPHIVHLIRQASGGMQNHLLDLVARLNKKGYQLAVISPTNRIISEALTKIDIPFYEIKMSGGLGPADVKAVFALNRLLRKLKPDVLHVHGNKSALVGVPAGRMAGLNAIVVTVHNFLVYQNAGWPLRTAAAFIDRRLAKRTGKIIAVSQSLKDNLVKLEGIEQDKVEVVYNGIDLGLWEKPTGAKTEARRRLGVSDSDFLIAAVGRLVDWKGHDVLVRAAAEIVKKRADVRVVIAGEGPNRANLEREIAAAGIEDRLLLAGRIADVGQLLYAADLFVLPSLKEPFGIVLLEAMAAGLPIIATDAGGVPEIISDMRNGMLVPPGDEGALARAIEKLLDDPGLREYLAETGRRVVSERFSLDAIVSRTEKVYADCLS